MFQIRLKECRESKGLTQGQLANEMNVKQSTVAMWETGDNKPRQSSLEKLAKILEVSVDYLLGASNEKKIKKAEAPFAAFGHDEEFTDSEIDQINDFIKFVKTKRENNK